LLVNQGRVTLFDGDLDSYQQLLQQQQREVNTPTSSRGETAKEPDRKEQRRQAAEIRQQLQPYTKKLQAVEKQIATLQQHRQTLEAALADPALYSSGNLQLQPLLLEKGKLDRQLEMAEGEWYELSESLDTLKLALSQSD
ncbi:MAG: ABC transporter ATP-binding protein, partial [Gammaproteobacteria bacterium]|nr:ABC transporter ATP-binding protein [Gammaproteobacteria bacterium]